jgi:hypothetical protein
MPLVFRNVKFLTQKFNVTFFYANIREAVNTNLIVKLQRRFSHKFVLNICCSAWLIILVTSVWALGSEKRFVHRLMFKITVDIRSLDHSLLLVFKKFKILEEDTH